MLVTAADRIEVYKTDGWRWRYVARNGRVLADSGQAYSRRIDCVNGAQRVTGGGQLVHDVEPDERDFIRTGATS